MSIENLRRELRSVKAMLGAKQFELKQFYNQLRLKQLPETTIDPEQQRLAIEGAMEKMNRDCARLEEEILNLDYPQIYKTAA
jgi:hypothetical protein